MQAFFDRPFAWLDLLVLLCTAGTLIGGILTLTRDPDPLRGKLKCIASTCLGLVFSLGGADTLLTLHLAPRLNFEGTITSLIGHGGKNPTCAIHVTNSAGSPAAFTGQFSCSGLSVGDEARIVWLTFDASIVRVDILSGTHAGTHLNSEKSFGAMLALGIGCYLIYVAQKVFKRNPSGIPEKTGRDTPLDGEVDTRSLLNLNKPN